MNHKEFSALANQTFDSCLALLKVKGDDYTKGAEDVLAHVKASGKEMDLSAERACWMFMNKQYSAITNYVKTDGQSESEPFSERIKDLINYSLILLAIDIERKSRIENDPGTNREPASIYKYNITE